jgi:hypothetical protein
MEKISSIPTECDDVPTEFNGKPIRRSWKEVGGKPKKFKIIHHKIYKLVECEHGYALLCIHDICKKLALGGLKCKTHREGKETYSFCRNMECTKTPIYGYKDKEPLFCSDHKASDMINVKDKRCAFPDCSKFPIFGHPGQRPQFCKSHKDDSMVDVSNKQCDFPGCTKQPAFGNAGQSAQFCKDHKDHNMIDVKSKRCDFPGCTKRPAFGNAGQPAQFCKDHKDHDMINVKSKQCDFPGCTKQPSYGYEGKPPQFCKAHKADTMINVKDKRCEFPGCIIYPCYGYEGNPPRFCKTHKHDTMIDVKNKQCEFSGCTIQPSYGYEGYSPRFCEIHKEDMMINVRSKRCEFIGCTIIANFGNEGQPAQFCRKHKSEAMINVKGERCEFPGCIIYPCYGYLGQRPQFCKSHSHHGMTDIRNELCGFDDCIIHPSYGRLYSKRRLVCREHASLNEYSCAKQNPICKVLDCQDTAYFIDTTEPPDPNFYPVRCHKHHHSTDIELTFRTCPNCQEELYFPSDKEVCMNCGEYRAMKMHKFKETIARHFLISNNIPFIYDKCISLDGSRYRPDFTIKAKFGSIIVEIDEHQHKRPNYINEDDRIRAIYHDVQLIKPNSQVLIIRFNPDEYKGVQYKLWERYKYLYIMIVHFIDQSSIGTPLGQLKLYYDEFDGPPRMEHMNIGIIPQQHTKLSIKLTET